MAKELLIYSELYSYSITSMIEALEQNINEDVVIRVNSPGGNVFASWGLFAKIKEHGNVSIKVDGIAASGAFNMLLYAKNVEALDVSRFMAHRSDAYTENDEQKALLNSINADLKKQLEARVSPEKFKEVTGYTIDDMFNPDTRVNIWLTAAQMKKLGIVSKVTKMKPEEEKSMAEAMAHWSFDKIAAEHNPEPVKNTDMTLEEIKSKFPAVYAQIVALGVAAEKTRVNAWMAFKAIDPDAVAKGISEGKEVDTQVMSEMIVKAQSSAALNVIAGAAPGAVQTAEQIAAAKTEKEKKLAEFEKSVGAHAGLKVA